MAIKKFSFYCVIILLAACNNDTSKNRSNIDSCTVAIPFENAKIAESLVKPDYSGVLNNYWGDDKSKLDFQHFFENGKLVKSLFYHENGKVQEELHYKCGSLHGVQKYFYEDGAVAKNTPYSYGRLEGVAEMFTEKGKLKSRAIFKSDSMISVKAFDDDGNEIKQ